jgi:integrase
VAHFYKTAAGWRAQVARLGVRQSQTFATKAAAEAWARQVESDLLARKRGTLPRYTVLQALEKYALEVSPNKKGGAWEVKRLQAFMREPWAGKLLQDLKAPDLAKWRDHRLQGITPGSVRRDLTVLRSVFKLAIREWQWIDSNPLDGLTIPAENKPRTRRVTWQEVRAQCRALGYKTGEVQTKSQQVALAFLIALRTAMRAGEILSLSQEAVDLGGRVAHLVDTKNGDDRDVPLSRAALRLFRSWRGWTIDGALLDALFRKARVRAGLAGFTFHDARRTALTWMARKLDPMTLAKVSGHKDLSILLNVYYAPNISEIAQRLDS